MSEGIDTIWSEVHEGLENQQDQSSARDESHAKGSETIPMHTYVFFPMTSHAMWQS